MFSISDNGNTSDTSQIFDIRHFQNILNAAHVCYRGGRLEFVPNVLPCIGLFHHNILRCSKCGTETPLTNFPIIHPINSTQQEPNKRITLAAATTGVGYRATKSIMSLLSLSIQSERTFLNQLHKFYDDIYDYAQLHFKSIIDKIKGRNSKHKNIIDITVSIDGTWKRRGHVSNYGIVFVIDVRSGLCIDFEVMSLFCAACTRKRSLSSETEFRKWYKKHEPFCNKNYDGTSKSMEKEGVIKLYKRSLINGLRYKYMVCDGDASAYESIKYYYIQHYQQQQQLASSQEGKPIRMNENNNMNYDKLPGTTGEEPEDEDKESEVEEGESESEGESTDKGDSTTEDEQSESTTEDEQSESTTEDEHSESTTEDEQSESTTEDEHSESTTEDEHSESTTEDEHSESTTEDEHSESTTEDEQSESTDEGETGVEESEFGSEDEEQDSESDEPGSEDEELDSGGETSDSEGTDLESEGEEGEDERERTRQISLTTTGFTSSNTKKKTSPRQLLADNKPWGGGAGRMTNQMMKKLSNNYALAIREGSRLSSGKKYKNSVNK